MYRFLGNTVGQIGVPVTDDTLIDACTALDDLLVPEVNRVILVTSQTKGTLLKSDTIKNANRSGDGGQALRTGEIANDVAGFSVYRAQGTPSVPLASIGYTTGSVDGVSYSAGAGTVGTAVDMSSAVGSWITIAGDDRPLLCVGATANSISFSPALTFDVAADAEIRVFDAGAINNASGYEQDYIQDLTIDGFTKSLRKGQMFTVGGTAGDGYTGQKYSAIGQPTTTSVATDIPLVADVADNALVAAGPNGQYNLAFNRNAIALITRPLAAPAQGAGALSYVASYNDLAIRVTITYDGKSQGHLVTVDLLCGVKVLNPDLGVVVLG